MQIADIITPDRIASNIEAKSKKRALEKISDIIASNSDSPMGANDIFESLIARERLGTTAIDHGVAIPHGRIKNSNKTIGAFVQFSNGIDCDALDHKLVNLMFALLVPEESTEEHLQLLARLAKMFSNAELRENLTKASSSDDIYELLINWDQSH